MSLYLKKLSVLFVWFFVGACELGASPSLCSLQKPQRRSVASAGRRSRFAAWQWLRGRTRDTTQTGPLSMLAPKTVPTRAGQGERNSWEACAVNLLKAQLCLQGTRDEGSPSGFICLLLSRDEASIALTVRARPDSYAAQEGLGELAHLHPEFTYDENHASWTFRGEGHLEQVLCELVKRDDINALTEAYILDFRDRVQLGSSAMSAGST